MDGDPTEAFEKRDSLDEALAHAQSRDRDVRTKVTSLQSPVLDSRTTTLQECKAVPRRTRI